MAVATTGDVAVAVGRPISEPDEQSQVEWWLDAVELIVKARLGDVSALDQDVLRYVEVEAVAAKVRRHGTAETSITVSVDDGSVTRRYENTAVGASDVTDEWWDLLAPSTTTSFTISPYAGRRTRAWDAEV